MDLLLQTGRFFFKLRDKLPVPLALALPLVARPRRLSWFVGLPVIFLGEIIRVWAIMHIGPTTRTREICADRLVTSGPYCCCRNPLYLANMLKIAGILIICGNLLYAALVILFYTLEFFTIIYYEENFLAQKFPDQFKLYRESVPALIGMPNKKFADMPRFSLAEALRSERKTFASTLTILILLVLATKLHSRHQI